MARKALIVDDEPSLRFVIREALAGVGWEASSSRTAPRSKNASTPSATTSSSSISYMPGMNGFEVLREIRRSARVVGQAPDGERRSHHRAVGRRGRERARLRAQDRRRRLHRQAVRRRDAGRCGAGRFGEACLGRAAGVSNHRGHRGHREKGTEQISRRAIFTTRPLRREPSLISSLGALCRLWLKSFGRPPRSRASLRSGPAVLLTPVQVEPGAARSQHGGQQRSPEPDHRDGECGDDARDDQLARRGAHASGPRTDRDDGQRASRCAPRTALRQGRLCSNLGRSDADKLGNARCSNLSPGRQRASRIPSYVLGFLRSVARSAVCMDFRRHAPCCPAECSGSSRARGHDKIHSRVGLEQEGEI